jgi:hypothetical protein
MEPQKYDTTMAEKNEELKELNYALHPFPYIHDDYIIESPKQATRYVKRKNGNHFENDDSATELQIDEDGNLLINFKSWGGGDTSRGFRLKLVPYKFKNFKIGK